MIAPRTRRWQQVLFLFLLCGVVAGVVALVFLSIRYIEREMAFSDIWVDGIHQERGYQAARYFASRSLTPGDVDRLIDLLPMCYEVRASERIGQLLDRSAPAGWSTSEKAKGVANRLVAGIDNLVGHITAATGDAEGNEGGFANEAARTNARGEALYWLERNGITPSRVAASVTALGYVGAGSPEAHRCLTERLSDRHKEVREAAVKALQRIGKPVDAGALDENSEDENSEDENSEDENSEDVATPNQ